MRAEIRSYEKKVNEYLVLFLKSTGCTLIVATQLGFTIIVSYQERKRKKGKISKAIDKCIKYNNIWSFKIYI